MHLDRIFKMPIAFFDQKGQLLSCITMPLRYRPEYQPLMKKMQAGDGSDTAPRFHRELAEISVPQRPLEAMATRYKQPAKSAASTLYEQNPQRVAVLFIQSSIRTENSVVDFLSSRGSYDLLYVDGTHVRL